MSETRYTLREAHGWFEVREERADMGFNPPLWISGVIIGKFRSREDARTFMLAYTEAPNVG